MSERNERIVSIFGSGEVGEGDQEFRLAFEAGHTLAELGYTIANGGYGGTMLASARGAAQVIGAQVIGVTCSVWKSAPNDFITREVRTDSLSDRISKLIELGQCGYVCLSGSTGTLVELASVWEMTFKGLLPRRPLVCVGNFWQPLIELMVSARPSSGELITVIESVDELAKFFPPLM